MGFLTPKVSAPKVPKTLVDAANAPIPAAPTPAPVTPLPDAGNVLTAAQNRQAAAVQANKSGRLSTILNNSDTLG